VRVVGTEVQGSWGVGDAIPGLGQLDRIGPMWIEVVDGAGHRGRLSLLDAVATGDPAPSPDRPPAVQRWAGRFNKLGEQDYEVDRALVRELVTAAGQPGAVPMIPVFDHGEIKGVRLGRVTAESIQAALGLKTGDILTAIDGAPLKTLDQLLDLYARLDQLSAVELSGTRGGKPLIRTLRLR
jgi:type II secretory pathway component PulC